MSATAETIARELGGAKRAGDGWLCRCPVPSHGQGRGDRSPSFRVADGDVAPLFLCYAGCDRRDIADELKRLGLLDGGRASSSDDRRTERRSLVREIVPDERALAQCWRPSIPIFRTIGEEYLTRRGLPGPFPPSLRFVERLKHPPTGRIFPAMVAAIATPDRKIIAAQATYLDPATGDKVRDIEPRWGFGSYANGAVRLGRVEDTLGIAEGTETGLAAQLLTGVPVWAALSARRLHLIGIPPTVKALHIFADDDAPGREAAERAADLNRHLHVEIRLPPEGCNDWNDALTQEADAP